MNFPAPSLEVGLSVERGGEGHVVEGALDGVGAGVGLHPLDAVLGLVRRQLAPQLLGKNVGLKSGERVNMGSSRVSSRKDIQVKTKEAA